MGIRIVQVDAFTSTPFAGNPAAVCVLPAPRDERWMQSVAQEMNLSRSEEHTSELQSRFDLVSRLLLEKKNTKWLMIMLMRPSVLERRRWILTKFQECVRSFNCWGSRGEIPF